MGYEDLKVMVIILYYYWNCIICEQYSRISILEYYNIYLLFNHFYYYICFTIG